MNDFLKSFLTNFDLSFMTVAIGQISKTVFTYITPMLLLLAIYIRLMETQIDALTSGGKYGAALRDILLWTAVLSSYFAFNALLVDFFNVIYAWLDKLGSVEASMEAFETYAGFIKKMSKDEGFFAALMSLGGAPYTAICGLIYYATLILLVFLALFLKIANLMIFGFAFVWGLIAIPVSISTTFNILRGWAYLYSFVLVWPIVQGVLLSFFTGMLVMSVNAMMANPTNVGATVLAGDIMLVFAVMNLLMMAVMIAAPFITNGIISNSPAGAAAVMPFVGAAMAAGGATMLAMKGGGSMLKKAASHPVPGGGSSPQKSLGQGPMNNASTNRSEGLGRGIGKMFSKVAGGNSSSSNAAPSSNQSNPISNTTPDDAQKKSQQRRRGVLITQQAKKAK